MSASSNAGRTGIWGASGSGKSSYVKKLIRTRKRLVIFDPQAEYAVDLPHIRNVGENLDGVRLAMVENWRGFRVAYNPPSGREPEALSALCKLLLRAQMPFKARARGAEGLTLVVEEMNMSFPVAGGAHKCKGFAEICSRGRHYGIEVIGAAQRIAEVDTRFRGNCSETVVLRQQIPRDVTAAHEATGIPKARIAGLDNLQWIHVKAGKITEGKISFGRAPANANHRPSANSNRAPKKGKKRA